MPSMPRTFHPRGAPLRCEVNREADFRRGSAAARGYGSRWAKASATFLARNPLCSYCALRGFVTPSALTDHLYPHRWPIYDGVFWETKWWVASCKPCHDSFKQSVERQGSAALDDLARRLDRPTFR
jgi:5-methylcytosine-specific restriction enzyme A